MCRVITPDPAKQADEDTLPSMPSSSAECISKQTPATCLPTNSNGCQGRGQGKRESNAACKPGRALTMHTPWNFRKEERPRFYTLRGERSAPGSRAGLQAVRRISKSANKCQLCFGAYLTSAVKTNWILNVAIMADRSGVQQAPIKRVTTQIRPLLRDWL